MATIRRLVPLLVTVGCLLAGGVAGAIAVPAVVSKLGTPERTGTGVVAPPAHRPRGVPIEPIDLIVNLAGERGRRYLKASIILEARDGEAKHALEQRSIEVRDLLNSLISEKRLEDIDGAQKRDLLRREIKLAVNERLAIPDAVLHVYFDQFIIE